MKKYLFILLLIPAIASAGNVDNKTDVAKQYISHLCTALYEFKLDIGRFPTNEEGLFKLLEPKINDYGAAGSPYFTQIETDPWGNQYQYSVHNRKIKVWSMGPDGLSNSEDDIGADICN